jgi:hypothetical protein
MAKRRRPKTSQPPLTPQERKSIRLRRQATRLLLKAETEGLDDDPLHLAARLARRRGIKPQIT